MEYWSIDVQLWERLYSRDQRDVIPESVADGYPESRKARIRLDTGSQLRFVRYDEKRGVSALSHY